MNTVTISGPMSSATSLFKTIVVKGNSSLSSLLIHPDTKYIIKHDFNLEGLTLSLPSNCILAIDGGSISNGTLVGRNSIIINVNRVDNILNNIILSGTWKSVDFLKSINIGTITSGEEPDVTITGTSLNPILNFVFPKGNRIPKINLTYSSATIEPNTLNIWGNVPTTITLGNLLEGYVNEYMIRFSTDDVSSSFVFPTFKNSNGEVINIKWGETLSLEPNSVYEISIVDEYGAITKFE